MEVETGVSRGASDAALIKASLSSPHAFTSIFERHFDAIHRYVARRCEPGHVDDLVAATFEVAFRRRASFEPVADGARPWLYGIASNLLSAEFRAARRRSALLPRLFAPASLELGLPEGSDSGLAEALQVLRRDQLEVLLLFAWEELSYEEIAVALGVPVGTVRSRMSRARAKLRIELERPGHE